MRAFPMNFKPPATLASDRCDDETLPKIIDLQDEAEQLLKIIEQIEKIEENDSQAEFQLTACLPYFEQHASYKLKRILAKEGVKTVLKSGNNRKNILCSSNSTKQPIKSAIYKIDCSCNTVPNPSYICQTIKKVDTRVKEHKITIEKGFTGK
jgi:hypothetical protein